MSIRQIHIELSFEYKAFHGLYENEKIEGNVFEVHLVLGLVTWEGQSIRELKDTVDYAEVYKLVKEIMDEPVDLLETLGTRIIKELNLKYKQLNEIKVKVTKTNPPIEGYSGTVSVTCHQTF